MYDDLEQKATIKIGLSITMANFILPKAIADFETIYKCTPIKVMGRNDGKIEEMLYNNEIDLGLIEGVIYNEELIKIPFLSYKLAIICSPKDKLALEEHIDINELI